MGDADAYVEIQFLVCLKNSEVHVCHCALSKR